MEAKAVAFSAAISIFRINQLASMQLIQKNSHICWTALTPKVTWESLESVQTVIEELLDSRRSLRPM